jgi:methionyl-tRNA synthetase
MSTPHTYITTIIPYVNARPHIGFALELVQADVLARFRRGCGDGVRFQAGTDDNSLKNVLAAQAAEYGADAVRWWLLREVLRVGDADFTVERLIARADDELANGLGNLVNRVISMIHRYRDGQLPRPATGAGPADALDLDRACREARSLAGAALEDFDFRQATAAVWAIVDAANRFVNRLRPWELAKAERQGTAADAGVRLEAVLRTLLDACQALGRELSPFLPAAAARIAAQCTPDEDGRLPGPSPLFRRLAAPAGLHAGDPQQEQQHERADDRPDDAHGVEAVDAHAVVLDQVLQETADEGTDDTEHDGAEYPEVVAAG